MLLTFWVTAALLCWARAFLSPRSPFAVSASAGSLPHPSPLAPAVLMYLCMALGCLTKGPVAVALPALIIAIYLLLSRPLRGIPRDILSMRPVLGTLIILVLYGTWVGYMTWRYPEYPAEFFGRQNLDRFAGSGIAAVPRWMMIATFVGGLMPWALLVGWASWDRRPRRNMPPAEKLLWIWGLSVLVVFTISKGRLPNYVLPAFPPTFSLLGGYLAGPADRLRRQLPAAMIATFVLLAALAVGAAIYVRIRFDQASLLPAVAAFAGLAVLMVPTWLLWSAQPALAIVPLLVGTFIGAAAVACGPAQTYCASRSTAPLTAPLAQLDPAGADPVVMATEIRYGAVLYAPRGWRFRHYDNREVRSLLPVLQDHDRPLYAILTSGRMLKELLADGVAGVHVSDRLTILQRCGSDSLVRIDPPGLSQRKEPRCARPQEQEFTASPALK